MSCTDAPVDDVLAYMGKKFTPAGPREQPHIVIRTAQIPEPLGPLEPHGSMLTTTGMTTDTVPTDLEAEMRLSPVVEEPSRLDETEPPSRVVWNRPVSMRQNPRPGWNSAYMEEETEMEEAEETEPSRLETTFFLSESSITDHNFGTISRRTQSGQSDFLLHTLSAGHRATSVSSGGVQAATSFGAGAPPEDLGSYDRLDALLGDLEDLHKSLSAMEVRTPVATVVAGGSGWHKDTAAPVGASALADVPPRHSVPDAAPSSAARRAPSSRDGTARRAPSRDGAARRAPSRDVGIPSTHSPELRRQEPSTHSPELRRQTHSPELRRQQGRTDLRTGVPRETGETARIIASNEGTDYYNVRTALGEDALHQPAQHYWSESGLSGIVEQSAEPLPFPAGGTRISEPVFEEVPANPAIVQSNNQQHGGGLRHADNPDGDGFHYFSADNPDGDGFTFTSAASSAASHSRPFAFYNGAAEVSSSQDQGPCSSSQEPRVERQEEPRAPPKESPRTMLARLEARVAESQILISPDKRIPKSSPSYTSESGCSGEEGGGSAFRF